MTLPSTVFQYSNSVIYYGDASGDTAYHHPLSGLKPSSLGTHHTLRPLLFCVLVRTFLPIISSKQAHNSWSKMGQYWVYNKQPNWTIGQNGSGLPKTLEQQTWTHLGSTTLLSVFLNTGFTSLLGYFHFPLQMANRLLRFLEVLHRKCIVNKTIPNLWNVG